MLTKSKATGASFSSFLKSFVNGAGMFFILLAVTGFISGGVMTGTLAAINALLSFCLAAQMKPAPRFQSGEVFQG